MSFRTSTPTNPSNNTNQILSRNKGDNILPSYYLNNEDS